MTPGGAEPRRRLWPRGELSCCVYYTDCSDEQVQRNTQEGVAVERGREMTWPAQAPSVQTRSEDDDRLGVRAPSTRRRVRPACAQSCEKSEYRPLPPPAARRALAGWTGDRPGPLDEPSLGCRDAKS